MKGLLIANGEIGDSIFYTDLIENGNFDVIICADGGANNAFKLKISPDFIVGDLDSIDENVKIHFEDEKVEFIKFPPKKDETDAELALEYLVKSGCNRIVMIGCTGKRIDHTLANIHLLYELAKKNIEANIVDEYNSMEVILENKVLTDKKGYTISLIPLSECVKKITLQGFYYHLNEQDLHMGSSRGISNVVTDEIAKIKFESGKLLLVFSQGS
ncbi:MAG TPA: thiamine diphosphokinase [Eubacteriaceae bacterium]|jgi:thiamine pyrophosphokinase|nr:thiamine diphosphokinase [Eubacteriaceae bacterium]